MTNRSALFLSCRSNARIFPSGDHEGSPAPGVVVAWWASDPTNTQMFPARENAIFPGTDTWGCGGTLGLALLLRIASPEALAPGLTAPGPHPANSTTNAVVPRVPSRQEARPCRWASLCR